MRKRKTIPVILVIVLAAAAVIACGALLSKTPYNDIITDNIDAYNNAAQKCYEYNNKNNDSGDCRYYVNNNTENSEPQLKSILADDVITFDDINDLLTVIDSYDVDSKALEYISVYDSFVALCNVAGRESLVYSADNKKPEFVNGKEDKDKHIYAKRITKNWFYVKSKDR